MPPNKIILEYQCFSVSIRNTDHDINIMLKTDECTNIMSPEDIDELNKKVNNILENKQEITRLFDILP